MEKIRLSNSDLIEFDCDEAETYCSNFKSKAGLALSHCCLKELSTMLKFAVEKCKVSVCFHKIILLSSFGGGGHAACDYFLRL